MNRNFQASTRRVRAAFATAAAVVTFLMVAGVEGLAGQYQSQSIAMVAVAAQA